MPFLRIKNHFKWSNKFWFKLGRTSNSCLQVPSAQENFIAHLQLKLSSLLISISLHPLNSRVQAISCSCNRFIHPLFKGFGSRQIAVYIRRYMQGCTPKLRRKGVLPVAAFQALFAAHSQYGSLKSQSS